MTIIPTEISTKLNQLKIQLASFSEAEDKYSFILARGKKNPQIAEKLLLDPFLIKGCISRLWLIPKIDDATAKLSFNAYSESMIVNGVVALVLDIVNDQDPQEILTLSKESLAGVGLIEALSMNRRNGLSSFLNQIHFYAKKFLDAR